MRVRPIRAWADSSRSFIPVPSVAAGLSSRLGYFAEQVLHSAITSNWHVQIVSRSGPLMLRTLEFPIPFGEGGWLLRDPFLPSVCFFPESSASPLAGLPSFDGLRIA